MLAFRHIGKNAGNGVPDTAKELQRLKRQDLLELLLEQMREADRLRNELSLVQGQAQGLSDLNESLKTMLDDRDAQLERLNASMRDKDAALQQAFAIIRRMAATKRESERLALQLQAENLLAELYLSQSDAAEPEAAQATKAAAERTSAAIEASVPAVEPEHSAEAAQQESQSQPQPEQVDYLMSEPEPVYAAVHFAHSGEVR